MSKSKNPFQVRLTKNEAQRAIYIDFEKNQGLAPTLLGILWQDPTTRECKVEQHVLEECFYSCGEAKASAARPDYSFALGDTCSALERVLELSEATGGPVVSWSTFDLGVFEQASCDETSFEVLLAIFRNAIPTAKEYKKRCFPEFVFPTRKKKGFNPWGTHSLQNYLLMIGYPVPQGSGQGLTGKNLAYLRDELLRKDCDHDGLTGTSKGKWSRVLSHNLHDCCGTREVMMRATSGYESGAPEPCGPCSVVGTKVICPGKV